MHTAPNLAELAEVSLTRLGERRSLIFEDKDVTNAQILERARRLQTALTGLGMKKGEIAVMAMINHPMVFSVFQGVFRTGGTIVPVMFQLMAPEIRYILNDTKARGIITDATSLFKARKAAEGLDHVKWIIVAGGKDNPEATPPEIALESLIGSDETGSLPDIDPHDTAMLLYTSGTTGNPKGVMLTHDNLIASAEAGYRIAEYERWTGPRVGLSAMPLAHMYGVALMNGGYLIPEELAGSHSVLMQWFEPEAFMRNIDKYKCESIAAVPTIMTMMLNHPKLGEFDLRTVNEALTGSAPLPVELARAFMERLGCIIREAYGMTENAAVATMTRASEPYRAGSVGRPHHGVELRIVDDEGKDLPAGERGEIVTRGRTVMKGYFNRPDATAETVRDGWLHSGDIGYVDDEGYLFVVDRKKDMIIRGGENIYPAELEGALYQMPGVQEAAVVGVPDPVYGESVVAFVVPASGQTFGEAEVMAHLAGALTKFKLPSAVHIGASPLPKNTMGKVLKRTLRERAVELAGKK